MPDPVTLVIGRWTGAATMVGVLHAVKGYIYGVDQRREIIEGLEHATEPKSHVYVILQSLVSVECVLFVANTDDEFNPKTTCGIDKGHSLLVGYFVTDESLEGENILDATGDWIRIHSMEPVSDLIRKAHRPIDQLPNYMFITSWLAAGNLLTPGFAIEFNKWLKSIGVSMNKEISIMSDISLRAVDIDLFNSALKHHLDGLDEKARNKATKHFNKVREGIKRSKMMK